MLNTEQAKLYFFRLAEHSIEGNIHFEVMLAQLHKEIVVQALELEGGNQCKTADRLGVHRNTLARWIALFQLDPKDTRRPRRAA